LQWNAYAYKDKKREAKRVEELAAKGTEKADEERMRQRKARRERNKQNEAWSSKTGQKEERDRRREKKGRKKAWMKEQAAKEGEAEKDVSSDGGDEAEDWEELKREDRMAKKARQAAFDTL